MKPFETFSVSSLDVACDGGGVVNNTSDLGHPKVYLHIDPDKGEITCPYCSRNYVLKPLSGGSAHAH